MTLVIDRRADLQGQAGLHAFLVGASAYPHLDGGTGLPARATLGLGQLAAGASTAYGIDQWLVKEQDGLRVPLATCRMLLAPAPDELQPRDPSAQELQRCADLAGLAGPATLDAFLDAAYEWRRDAATQRDNLTWFYFAGHSLQRSRSDEILLLSNFGDGRGGLLRNSVSINQMMLGMAPTSEVPAIARTQLYFVDATRAIASDITWLDALASTAVFDVSLGTPDDRSAPVFSASLAGGSVPAAPGEASAFSQLLTGCLNGQAAAAALPGDNPDAPRWGVTVLSLIEGLRSAVAGWKARGGPELALSVASSGPDSIIRYLAGPPEVQLTLMVEPDSAAEIAHLTVYDEDEAVILDVPPPLAPYPYALRLRAGAYRIAVIPEPPVPYLVPYQKFHFVRPPVASIRARLLPR